MRTAATAQTTMLPMNVTTVRATPSVISSPFVQLSGFSRASHSGIGRAS